MTPTTRRGFFARSLAALTGGSVVFATNASATTPIQPIQKVVYHLSDLDKVNFVLGNIRNHIEGKGGPDKVKITLVIHGPPLASFVSDKASPRVTAMVEKAVSNGVSFLACGNTMKAQDIVLTDLFSGFDIAEEGGVVRIVDLQAEGYLYLRP